MNELNTKLLAAFSGSIFGYLYGGWSTLFSVLYTLCILDFITGLLAGYQNGELKSKKGFVGIIRKILMFFLIAVAHQIDILLGTTAAIRDATILFYAVNEVISILENAGRAGLPLPEKIMRAIEVIRTSEYKKHNKPRS
jgi:toxin secretion/phage lysis holin